MNQEVDILIAEDDEGHAMLIKKNLARSGIANRIFHFKDGQELLDFLEGDPVDSEGPHREAGKGYLLLLDIRMPRVDGLGVLTRIKADEELQKIPVIMLTTSQNPEEVRRCHQLGCSNYIAKPVEYNEFVSAIKFLGLFLAVVQIPAIGGRVH